jgi:hypothetical protein
MKKTIIAAFSACAAVVACAVDPDTFAFYSFKDGEAGTSAVGVTLANQVDASSSVAGSATTNANNTTASATFVADAPGPYIYSSSLETAELLCAAPQSIHLASLITALPFFILMASVGQCRRHVVQPLHFSRSNKTECS